MCYRGCAENLWLSINSCLHWHQTATDKWVMTIKGWMFPHVTVVWHQSDLHNIFRYSLISMWKESCAQLSCIVLLFQFQAVGFYLWTGREFPDSSAAHDPEPRIPCHQLHASAIVPGPSDNRGARLIPWTYKVPCYLPQLQQWAAAQTGESWDVWTAGCYVTRPNVCLS